MSSDDHGNFSHFFVAYCIFGKIYKNIRNIQLRLTFLARLAVYIRHLQPVQASYKLFKANFQA